MVRFVILLMALVMFVSVAVMLILSALVFLALACAVGLPIWYMSRHWRRGVGFAASMNPIERLQNLYVEGKIDLFEFERRVAQLIAVER